MSDTWPKLARTVMTDPVHVLAFGFGSGLSPFAPGTVGSLVGVLFAWLTAGLRVVDTADRCRGHRHPGHLDLW